MPSQLRIGRQVSGALGPLIGPRGQGRRRRERIQGVILGSAGPRKWNVLWNNSTNVSVTYGAILRDEGPSSLPEDDVRHLREQHHLLSAAPAAVLARGVPPEPNETTEQQDHHEATIEEDGATIEEDGVPPLEDNHQDDDSSSIDPEGEEERNIYFEEFEPEILQAVGEEMPVGCGDPNSWSW